MSEQNQKYLNIGTPEHPVTVWWSDTQPDRVHVTTGSPQFSDENGGKFGLRIVFSSNPKSADYNPGNFNRVARALRDAGIPAPAEVEVHPRHLRYRPQIIADAAAAAAAAETPLPKIESRESAETVTDPAEFGWAACEKCGCVVVSLEVHTCVA